jgi:hypothetical protein
MAEKKAKKSGEPRKTPEPSVPATEFVQKWQGAKSLADAKTLLGDGASSRAARMRKAGVKLKEFAGGGRKLDVAGLNALIAA